MARPIDLQDPVESIEPDVNKLYADNNVPRIPHED